MLEGKCTSALHPSAVAAGSKKAESYDCAVEISKPLWLECKENALIGEKPALIFEESKIMCDYGGEITLATNGQGDDYNEDEREELLFAAIENALKKLFDPNLDLVTYFKRGGISSDLFESVNRNVYFIISKLITGAANKDFKLNIKYESNDKITDYLTYAPSIYALMFIASDESWYQEIKNDKDEIEKHFIYFVKDEEDKGWVTMGIGNLSMTAGDLKEKLLKYASLSGSLRDMISKYSNDSDDAAALYYKIRDEAGIIEVGLSSSSAVAQFLATVPDHIPSDEILKYQYENGSQLSQNQMDALLSMAYNMDPLWLRPEATEGSIKQSPKLNEYFLSEDEDAIYNEIAYGFDDTSKRRLAEAEMTKGIYNNEYHW